MAGALPRMLWQHLPRAAAAAPATRAATASSSKLQFALGAFQRRSIATLRSKPNSAPLRFSRQTTRRFYSSEPPKSNQTVKFWPFFLIILGGTGGYILLANQRNQNINPHYEMPALEGPKTSGQLPAPHKSTPTFSGDDVTVIFVLGGPGAGKGTQCANLVKDYGFTHLSAGDLLRAEQDRPGSQFGELIRDCIRNGAIVPMEVTVQLLENAMTETINRSSSDKKPGAGEAKKAKFLIDGFPRKMDQALKFEEAVCPARFVLFYDCPEEEMERRLLERGKTSGRADDNAESIRKRFRTFVETSMPVVDYYAKQGRVVKVNATATPDNVYKDTQRRLTDALGKDL
ncbi:uncharacterized protein E0L32_003612 [Thyridium curvatum]|uniref:Uridylate kinase n=1 Tax=Thyridium curvatum TaxID=1093900 RepID=A0A507BI63_9PEZI|nr:uncharacterized protein E0L32_003612 [Thyridium curvatum]TPX16671.1 hypothetical protein E0L32_003612 [Thyridium curvatum]